jgi:hypothetical protein
MNTWSFVERFVVIRKQRLMTRIYRVPRSVMDVRLQHTTRSSHLALQGLLSYVEKPAGVTTIMKSA